MHSPLLESVLVAFSTAFGGPASRLVQAPGRVNLIGEHTDYNDGFVFPMAIEPAVFVVCRARADGQVHLASEQFPGARATFSLLETIERGEPAWANYSRGVAAGLISAGIPLVGMDALLVNTLPMGGGLSSSAAIEVGTALALLALSGRQIDPDRLALIAQKAEHDYARVPCGIMDQMIVAAARPGHAMLLDCRDLSRRHIPIDGNEIAQYKYLFFGLALMILMVFRPQGLIPVRQKLLTYGRELFVAARRRQHEHAEVTK